LAGLDMGVAVVEQAALCHVETRTALLDRRILFF
jgi:hypothetical protein